MHPVKHATVSGLVSVAFAYMTQNLAGTLVCLLSGVLIDMDHLIDFIIAKRRMTLSFKELDRFCGLEMDGKLYFFLHSYELVFLLWLFLFFWPQNAIILGLVVGFTFHLLLDVIGNPLNPFAYFFIYRINNGFTKLSFFKEGYWDSHK